MKARYHVKQGDMCLYDHEPWPCEASKLIAQVRQEIADEVRPDGDEPACCDVHAAQWQTRMDVAEEIEEWRTVR